MSTVIPFSRKSDVCKTGGIRYNGYEFPTFSDVQVDIQPVYSEYGHAIIARRIIVKVTTTAVFEAVSGGGTFDGALDDFLSVLQEPGGTLEIVDKSVGHWVSYGTKTEPSDMTKYPRDAEAGPHPKVTSVIPIVHNKCAKISWECESVINNYSPADNDDRYDETNIYDFHATRNITFGDDGQTSIITRGTIKVPKHFAENVAGNNLVIDEKITAVSRMKAAFHLYIETFEGTLQNNAPWGYQRSVSFNISEAGTKADFTVTDTEIPSDNPFMPYIFHMAIDHNVSSNLFEEDSMRGAGFSSWLNRLTGTITLSKGVPRIFAWMAFISVFESRTQNVLSDDKKRDGLDGNFVVISMELNESIYTRDFRFTLTYMTTAKLEDLLDTVKLFKPVDAFFQQDDPATTGVDESTLPKDVGEQWQDWHATMSTLRFPKDPGDKDSGEAQPPTFGPNGLCSTDYLALDTVNAGTINTYERSPIVAYRIPDPIPESNYPHTKGSDEGIKPYEDGYGSLAKRDKTWVRFDNTLDMVRDVSVVSYTRAEDYDKSLFQEPSQPTPDAIKNDVSGAVIAGIDSPGNDPIPSRTKTVLAAGEDKFYIRMTGRAIRAFHPIAQPVVHQVGGQNVYPVGRQFYRHRRIGGNTEQPVYQAEWVLTYVVDGSPLGQDLASTQNTTAKPEVLT